MYVQHCKASYSAVWQTYATSYKHSAVETKDGQQGRQTQGHVRGHGVPVEACPGPKWDGGWKINFLQAELYRQWSHQG